MYPATNHAPTVTDGKVPAHVGILGNERADSGQTGSGSCEEAHHNCVLSASEREERRLESLADALVPNLLAAE